MFKKFMEKVKAQNSIIDQNPLYMQIAPEEKLARLVVPAPGISLNEGEAVFTKLRNFPKYNGRKFSFDKREYKLKLAVIDTATKVYIDDLLVIHHQEDRSSGKLAFFAERGSVTFKNTVLKRIGEKK